MSRFFGEDNEMSTYAVLASTTTLSPSELVLLKGEQFAKKSFSGNIKLLHTDNKVSAKEISQVILMAALLANEQTGSVRLEVGQKKALLGLCKVNTLYIAPGDTTVSWPDNSLEAEIPKLAKQLLADKERNEVSTIFYTWLGKDSVNPWQSVVEMVKEGMASRGYLEIIEQKRLKFFTLTHYDLPESTYSLADQQSAEPVKELLTMCERTRPEVWKFLVKHINTTISQRTIRNNTD